MFNRQLYRWLTDLPNATPLADIHPMVQSYRQYGAYSGVQK
jgi:hypothetical protein